MTDGGSERAGVGLWATAVLGAVTLLLGPLTRSLWVDVVGLAVCLTASVAVVLWYLRR